MKTEIGIKLQVAGFHCWNDAPPEVGFLRSSHRHIFGIECIFEVKHDDRDLEFFLMQKAIKKHLDLTYTTNDFGYHFGGMSCEMIAKELADKFDLVRCKVDEDGENYAIVSR